jgi:putative transposase
MQIGRFTSEQILAVLEEAEQGGATISALCRQHNINRITFYRWRKAYGGPIRPRAPRSVRATMAPPAARGTPGSGGQDTADPAEVARDLERENARLKRRLAERDLEVDLLKQALGKRW